MSAKRKRSRNEDKPNIDEGKHLASLLPNRNKTSIHFIRSPSSPFGSIESLGSLIDTLSGYNKCYCLKCITDRKRHINNNKRTTKRIDDILCHFRMCPQFNNAFKKHIKDCNNGVKELNDALSLAVGHLCPYNCFLRAFTPARKWHELRMSISYYGNTSPDLILKDWSCFLEKSFEGTDENGPRPKVVFVAPNGVSMNSGDAVLKALGFIGCNTKRINTLDKQKKSIERCDLPTRSLQLKHRSIIESELISSFPTYGVQCKLDIGSTRFARRALYETMDDISRTPEPATKKIVPVSPPVFKISPFGLIEELFKRDPWRLLVSAILLNRTRREQVDFVMYNLLKKYDDSKSMERADQTVISAIIRPLGIRHRRAETLIRFSKEFNALIAAKDGFKLARHEIMELYGCGQYAADAYEIFILGKDDNICVSDHALQYYVDYKRGISK